jgi:hypothetical protein
MMGIYNDIYFNQQIMLVILVIGIFKGTCQQQFVDAVNTYMMVIFHQYDRRKWWI